MATMKDIAKQAGVSTSTVSHVINQTRYVSDDIAERVNLAAKQLNYAPSALARSLKMNRTKTLGMLVTTSTNPFFGEVVKGVERSCYQQGYNLILCNTEGDEQRMRASIDTLLQKRVDGLMLMCTTLECQQVMDFERYPDIPVVVMDWGPTVDVSDKILDNSYQGGMMATQYLIDCGHKHIGCITGPLSQHQALNRLQGYQAAMQQAGLVIKDEWVIESNFECEGGYDAMNTLLACTSQPTALFASNDMMAMGAINAASKHQVAIPETISIIGYDDIRIAEFMTPALTTIHQPKYRLGKAAVEAVLARLQSADAKPQMIKLEPTLVERHSVKSLC
ncbi:substrate-binding domain-containing protein [Vibrio palustris]|uniref:Ribose operon repressor n=1 Tax=Vibrio palustris TaxID=1918946 RepID=A0A1R4B5K3_9VIBR|nr:substrate-binding domain-containing protein [Vibrio palustris]SJL84176.1 Ribose operon repressor [Vibrio palustris]